MKFSARRAWKVRSQQSEVRSTVYVTVRPMFVILTGPVRSAVYAKFVILTVSIQSKARTARFPS